MKKLNLKTTDKLRRIDRELIGDGRGSRLDIMLDVKTGEVWTNEYYSHEHASYKRYADDNILCVGYARNFLDDEPDQGLTWWVELTAPKSGPVCFDTGECVFEIEAILKTIERLFLESK